MVYFEMCPLNQILLLSKCLHLTKLTQAHHNFGHAPSLVKPSYSSCTAKNKCFVACFIKYLNKCFYLNGLAYGSAVQMHSLKCSVFGFCCRWAVGTRYKFHSEKKFAKKRSPFLSLYMSFFFKSHLSFNCLLFSYTITHVPLFVIVT